MIEASLDSGAFDTFVLSDGMIGQSIVDNIGADLEGSFGSMPGAISKGSKKFADLAAANGMDGSCLLYTSPSPRDRTRSRMPSSA